MAADERLKWLELRINSSLRLRSEDIKNLMAKDDNRHAFYEFINNEDVKHLFVFTRNNRQIEAALQPPTELQNKSVFFLKCNPGTKLTRDNMDTEIFYMDCSKVPLEHLELTIREVFLPLLATSTQCLNSGTGSGDEIMDILHRLMAAVEVSQGLVEGKIVLSLPSIEVLAEVAASPSRRITVLHVLETIVIGWIKQIRGILQHDPQSELLQQFGKEPGPLDEICMWKSYLSQLQSVNNQLDSPVAINILQNLETANSQYAHSFSRVRKDISKAESETSTVLKFLSTMEPWYIKLHTSENPQKTIKLFKPLMHVLQLVWTYSVYYHQIDKFHHLLRLLSNEVVHRARTMVGDDVLKEPLESYSRLKEVLHMCAAFRGTYLDYKDKADDQNVKNNIKNTERLATHPQDTLFTRKVYGRHAYTPQYGIRHMDGQSCDSSVGEDDLLTDSPWPQRNAPCFNLLNSFMERCNDVLELVETTHHFRLLAGVTEIGVAGSSSFDAMVNELHSKYSFAMKDFSSLVKNVLSFDNTKTFELAFFNLRTTIKSLEKNLSGILCFAFKECPVVQSQLRLLEIFEGISGRELVQTHLKDVDKALVDNFIAELQQVKDIFMEHYTSPPCHYNMPKSVSKLMWVQGLKERIRIPMEKIKKVSPRYLEGDRGWHIRDMYAEIMQDLEKFEEDIISKWRTDAGYTLTHKLRQPLLIADEYDEDIEVRPPIIHVNLDPQLLLLLKEFHYFSQPPFRINLPESALEFLRNTDSQQLSMVATRLETIVSKYNTIMRAITAIEYPLFERKLAEVDKLIEQGMQHCTWKMKESADFIESAMSLICLDVYQTLDIVQTNCGDIVNMCVSWSKKALDVFSAREKTRSYSKDELVHMHKQITDELEVIVIPAGNKIHNLLQQSYEAVQISQASPAWKNYVDYIDAIVLGGLKQTTLASLKAVLNTLVQTSTEDSAESSDVPILTIRLELIENSVAFCPPLDQSISEASVQELIQTWLQSYTARGKLVKMLGPKGSYEDFISVDEEVQQLLTDITRIVDDNSKTCRLKLLETFKSFGFLWEHDVNQTFEYFLEHGFMTLNQLNANDMQRTVSRTQSILLDPDKLETSQLVSRVSSAKSGMSQETLEHEEYTSVCPESIEEEKNTVLSLENFDLQMDVFKTARDEVMGLKDYYDEGWIRVNLKPIKQVLTTYASKWIWTFTKYLSDQMTLMLETLDMFLRRVEPEVESITGEERDTASFMKIMRLFNEVSAQQSEMDDKFLEMHRIVLLLRKYNQVLPDTSQFLFSAAPGRWNNLKTKVSLAKQRLGPRIQEESARITKDLETFAARVSSWADDLKNSKVHQRDCSIDDAHNIIKIFSEKLLSLENEAQDLIELQELLEASVVNFSLLIICQQELLNLKLVWETVRVIEEQQEEWNRHQWQKMNTKFLKEETDKQLHRIRVLPKAVSCWDVYIGIYESVTAIQACLPLIDDLSNSAMRTRHWKQLVRVTGGAVTIDSDTLKKMTLKELLSLGLQQHVDDVRAIVQRAVKDLEIENALRTSEEVWLSKIFELRQHVQNKVLSSEDVKQDSQSESNQSEVTGPVSMGLIRNVRTTSRISNHSLLSKNQRSSISSLPSSLLNLEKQEPSRVMLLTNTDPIFEELEHHQIKLQAMQSSSAVGSFLDEILKWQKKLQTIEAVLQTWLEVQNKWVELEEVYTSIDVCHSLYQDANRFGVVNKDFKHLMGATEKNPNVLQCCSRKNILKILEHMGRNLDICHKSLLRYLERRRQIFPRFFFLSMEDVLHIVCSGHDLNVLNLYINKLLENVGSLVYEEVENSEKYSFVITGIQSILGEKLQFDQVVSCEGQIETWLLVLLHHIKVTLQSQLVQVLGHQKLTKPIIRLIQSTGTRKVSVPFEDQDKPEENIISDQEEQPNTSPNPSIKGSVYENHKNIEGNTGDIFSMNTESSWALDHVTEIVHLATNIQMTRQITTALEQFNNGNKQAVKESLKMIKGTIEATVVLLKSLETEKEEVTNQQKEKEMNLSTVDYQREREYGDNLKVPVLKSPFDKVCSDVSREPSRLSAYAEDDMRSRTPEGETYTVAPLDTLSQIIPPPDGGRISSVSIGEQIDASPQKKPKDLKLILFASQIHKLRSLLLLLAHFRDLMERLITVSNYKSPIESFDWKSQMNTEYNEETKTTSVTCMRAHFDYGFEYLGSTNREVISPLTEKMFVMITQAVQAHMGVLCVGPREGNKAEIVCEISKCLGQPLYMFQCTESTDYTYLQNICKGMATTGCWVCFNNISLLPPSCLSLLSQLVSTIMDAMRAGKIAVRLQSDDVHLSHQGAFFGLMNSDIPMAPQDVDSLLIYPSAACQLHDMILNQFRVISLSKPDFLLSIEFLLLSQGFIYGRELARKTIHLYKISQAMFGTNTSMPNKITFDSAKSASIHGWSMQSVKKVIQVAGSLLQKICTKDSAKYEHYDTKDLASIKLEQEEKALVTTLCNTFLPRLTSRDSSVFTTIVSNQWPNTDIPLLLYGKDKDSLNLSNTLLPVAEYKADHYSSVPDVHAKQAIEDYNEAIAVAITDLDLLPCIAFQARVMQLSQLSSAYQSILVVGTPGCGKSECIKTFAVAEKVQGKKIIVQSIFTKAVESGELLGHYDENTREWKDGLLIAVLRKLCVSSQRNSVTERDATIQILQLDGECDNYQMELIHTVLNHNGSVVMTNNERLHVPETVRFIWELDCIENMSQSLLATTGVLIMSSSDVGWKMMLIQWLKHIHIPDKDLLTEFCDIYLEKVIDYITHSNQSTTLGGMRPESETPQLKRVISHSIFNMVCTFTKLLEVLVNPSNGLSAHEYERLFNYSAVWAFGGTLAEEHRQEFSNWWREHFKDRIDYPSDGTVFDYVVVNETHEFCKWSNLVPSYTGTLSKGIPQDAFVHTARTELLHLLGLLTDAGKSVMLVGESGCGKTGIINERLHTVCSGEVAEVLSLTLYSNRFTNARLLFDRIDEKLEWKYGRTFIPHGSKKLLCLIDDINLSQTDKYGYQTACELIREHLDDGGFYNPTNHTWRYVKGVTYVTSVNLETTANVPTLNQRLLRHFAIFACPYPGAGELETIFSTLLSSHFFSPESTTLPLPTAPHMGITNDKKQNAVHFTEQSLQSFMVSVVKVTVELFERLRSMFLPTSRRCHYLFTVRDLGNIFRNICLSLVPGCSKRNLILLWQHECFWVYGKRMVSDVDFRRFRQAFVTAVKRQFIDDDQVRNHSTISQIWEMDAQATVKSWNETKVKTLLDNQGFSPEFTSGISAIIRHYPPVFSNLFEQDGGVKSGNSISVSEEDAKTDLYSPVKSYLVMKGLLERGLEEYNKTHPYIRIAFYKCVVEQVCRLSRVLASPHEVANTVLVAEGCPVRCFSIVSFAATLCGFTVFQISPIPTDMPTTAIIEHFKANMVSGYCRAGTKKEKLLLLLHEEELVERNCLVFLTEFIISGAITQMFSQEEQTTIINSIRTDVTQAGLTYTRDVAWNYFLRTVRNNFRIILISCGGSEDFQYICREYPSFIKNVNFLWFPHWSQTQLIEHAMFHLEGVKWMSEIHKENVAHMLASMHLVLRQQDGGEKTNGEYAHLSNTSYEKFVESFISLANRRNTEINKTHDAVTKTLSQIREENKAAIKLKKQLEHEIAVLEECKAGTIKMLSQIGQDTAISEQQIKVVRKQMEKITCLKKRLPEYQVAHERAVYKVIAIVADTKKAVKLMSTEDLVELRAMHKPSLDIEDLMAAIIMLLKSPSSDLTWQKGAKRQMANLERFIEELATFDDFQIPDSTLDLVESYLKKPSFDPDMVEKKTNNAACGALCKWVKGVVRYHRMMISKVKPLHKKVEETTQAMDSAQHKMDALENKRKVLESRLAELALSFEEATIEKNKQEKKTVHMRTVLDTAAQLRSILHGERQRCQQIFDSFDRRKLTVSGGCAMAAAFTTYLGPYHCNFRRTMLTIHWPECLRERGIPLVIDSIDSLKGRVVDWSFSFLKTASGASSVSEVYAEEEEGENIKDSSDSEEKDDANKERIEEKTDIEEEELNSRKDEVGELRRIEITQIDATSESKNKIQDEQTRIKMETVEDEEAKDSYTDLHGLPKIPEENDDIDDDMRSGVTGSTATILTSAQYNKYIRSLIKILVGDIMLNQWLMKDFGPQQLENAAILCTSWQRPPIMIDPNDEGPLWLANLNKHINKSRLISLDMENRSDLHFLAAMEKAIIKGEPVLLKNCGESVNSMFAPFLYNFNTANEKDVNEDSRLINFCGRHILCHPDFRLYLSTNLHKPSFNAVTASSVTLINFGPSHEMLIEDLLTRSFVCLRPELYQEKKHALKNLQLQKDALYNFSEKIKDHVLFNGREIMLNSAKTLEAITNITEAKLALASQLSNTQVILDDLDLLKDEFYPFARRAAFMYSLMCSLASLRPVYHFTMKYFLELFDEVIGGDFPKEFFKDSEEEGSEDTESDDENDKKQRTDSFVSQTSGRKKLEGFRRSTEEEGEHAEERSKLTIAESAVSESTSEVQRLFHGSEVEEIPRIELPNTTSLPTEGVEYTCYSRGKVKQLMDIVTSLVYHRIKMSLFEEDRLLFSVLMILGMKVEAGEDITSEELSFFCQGNPGLGMQLTLDDFNCKAIPPQWLPREKWEDIMALSVLPSPLDSLCVDFAIYSHEWKEWFESLQPEKLQMPIRKRKERKDTRHEENTDDKAEEYEKRGDPDTDSQRIHDLGSLNDFHQLLILRMLRPDRLPSALLNYTQHHLNLHDPEEEFFNVSEVLADARKHWGVLLLLPQSPSQCTGHTASRIKLIKSPVDELLDLAKSVKIPVARAVVYSGSDISVEEALNAADKNEGWAVIESIHLANANLMSTLIKQLQRIHKSKMHIKTDKGEEASKFCIWLTAEMNNSLPPLLVQSLLKIAWNSVLSYPNDNAGDYEGKGRNILDTFSTVLPDSYLSTAIVSTLRLIPTYILEKLAEEGPRIKKLVFAVAVIHAVLISRQLFGSAGLIHWHPFGTDQLLNAIELVSSQMLHSDDKTRPSVEDLCYYISNMIYGAMVSEDSDKAYISALSSNIIKSIMREPQSQISFGGILIPVPPDSVAITNYADWFAWAADEKITLQALHLSTTVERYTNHCSSNRLLANLNHMFRALNMEAGDVSEIATNVSIVKLRSAIDICLEQLPLSLNLGDMSQFMKMAYHFPNHYLSIISMRNTEASLLPTNVGYALFQECLWMNTVLCHIRQDLNDLQINLVGGSGALPKRLLPEVYSLQEEHVPVSWVHPNCQPCTHSLISWLEDLNKSYQQLNKWLHCGMIPTIVDGQLTESPVVAKLTSVWLGGLVNPQALLTALKIDKAILAQVSLEDVNFECMVLKNADQSQLEDGALFVTDIILENAAFDYETNSLQDSNDAGFICLKCLCLKPVVKAATPKRCSNGQEILREDQMLDNTINDRFCELPVYMNKSRQVEVWSLPVMCSEPDEKWDLVRAAFILDPGLPNAERSKSRAYLMLQNGPPLMHSEQEMGETEAEDENEYNAVDDSETLLEDSGEESSSSQMSYKAMSPKASPLPEELKLQREMPLYENDKE